MIFLNDLSRILGFKHKNKSRDFTEIRGNMVLWAATLDLAMAWPGDENRWKVMKNPKSHQKF